MIEFISLHKQYLSIKDEIDKAIASVIETSSFIGGEHLKKFEESFASYQQVKHCIGVANGTDAIEIALESLNLPKGSEVLVPGNSFIASSEAVTRSGYRVVFCDCGPNNYTISIEDIAKRITPLSRAIVAVHLYGHPCDMDGLLSLAKKHDLKIIEDCAQAHGAEYKNSKVGAIGDIGTFSFYPGKNLGAYGDAGAIVTNDENLAKKCRMIANHGRIAKYNHEFEGRNSRLDGIQAAVLNVKLNHLEKWLEKRREIAAKYMEMLQGIDKNKMVLPREESWARHVWHLFVIRVPKCDDLQKYLSQNGIPTGKHYPIALPKLKAYDYLGQGKEDMFINNADSMLLSLPIYPELTNIEIKQICDAVKKYFLVD